MLRYHNSLYNVEQVFTLVAAVTNESYAELHCLLKNCIFIRAIIYHFGYFVLLYNKDFISYFSRKF